MNRGRRGAGAGLCLQQALSGGAAGFVLLVMTTTIAAIYNRYFSLDRLWGGSDT